jgi:hypothetical protein
MTLLKYILLIKKIEYFMAIKIWVELCVTTQVVTGASEWKCPEGGGMIL